MSTPTQQSDPRQINPKGSKNIRASHVPRKNRSYATKLYKLRKARAIPAYIPAEPVLRHLHALASKGLTVPMIARASGVSPATIDLMLAGKSSRMLARTGTALLAVTHLPHPAQALVPNVGTSRRLRALYMVGWSRDDIGARLGVSKHAVAKFASSKTVTYETWAKVHDLYEQLSHIPGPSLNTRRIAKREGYSAPLDWEYLDIDDPDVTPKPAAATPRHVITQQKRDRDNQIRAAVNAGRPLHLIARDLGASIDHVRRISVAHNKEAA